MLKKAKPGKKRPAKSERLMRAKGIGNVKQKNTQKVYVRKSPLSKSQLAEFREAIIQKRKALLGDMAGIEKQAIGKNRQDGTGDLSNMPTHMADIGSDNFEHEFSLGLLESERALLQEINEALERIDKNTYGLCVATGKPIGLARLRARPWAKYCIDYAKMLEKGLVSALGEEPHELDAEEEEEEGESAREEPDSEDKQQEEEEVEEPEVGETEE
jgi:RNA polymerase-binding protein DksA